MTKKEIMLNTTWDEFEMGTCRVFVETLNQYIPVLFFQDHKPNPAISNKMLQSVNDILEMDKSEFDRLEEILGGEVYAKSNIQEIHIDQDNDGLDSIYSEIIIRSVSNTLISIIIKDGKFLCINNGTYFDALEN